MDINRIDAAIDWSKRNMEIYVKNRKDAVSEFVGMHYSENGSKRRVPTNFLELAVSIYVRLLAAKAPRCQVTTRNPQLSAFAADLEEVVNCIPGEIGLDETLRDAVLEALFSIAIVKVGLGDASDNAKIGDEPFVSIVQLDHYFCDMSAKTWREVQYEGNDYWMEKDVVKEFYGVDLDADDDESVTSTGVEETHSISVNESAEPLNPRVLLRDVYLVRENRVVTYAVESKKVLRNQPWDGPEGSPYVKLWFEPVPGNLMPLPPVAVWRDLHELGNALFRKLGKQADSKKTVATFQGGNDEEIVRLKQASDGEGIRYNGPKPEAITVGGVDSGTLAFYLQLKDIFNVFAGNLDSLGGLSPQADTATQEKLISQATSARVEAMADRTVDFAKKIFRRLAWYAWTDPVRRRTIHKSASKEFGFGITKEWTPETRDGDFIDYNFGVDVFSMQDDSPATRIQKFFTVMERLLLPCLPQLQEQGAYLDMKRICEYVGKNSNMPQLSDFVVFMDDPQEVQEVRGGSPTPEYVSTKAPFSHRVYERVNRPGATRHGRDAALTQVLMGGKPQQSEMDALSAGRSMT